MYINIMFKPNVNWLFKTDCTVRVISAYSNLTYILLTFYLRICSLSLDGKATVCLNVVFSTWFRK